jgi:hypothetical protein
LEFLATSPRNARNIENLMAELAEMRDAYQ